MNLRRWLTPGIGVKRWLVVVFVGLLLLALAAAHVLRQATRDLEPGGAAQVVIDIVTIQFLPYPLRGLIVGLVGLVVVAYGAARVIRAVTDPFIDRGGDTPLVEVLHRHRFLARGPRIVAIGGGTGLSILLRGLKEHTSNLTAIVTVADDGGSSGTLRAQLGIPPVGDIRSCIAALADAEPQMSELLGYRFPGGQSVPGQPVETEPGGLGGHPVGNLLLAALTALEGGDFEEGVRRMNRVLAVRGRVIPVSATPINLHALTTDGTRVDGQSMVTRTSGIERVWISPEDARPSADALEAIGSADLIVLGPGSLFTSLLPVLLVPGVAEAVVRSAAVCVYVCNVATQAGETAGLDLAAHVERLAAHVGPAMVDVVLANTRLDAREPDGWQSRAVPPRWPPRLDPVPVLALDDVVDPINAHHHEPARLAAALLDLYERERAVPRPAAGRSA
jgi:uncharacterized cofD-like protein